MEKIEREGFFYDVDLQIRQAPDTIHDMVAIDLENWGIKPADGNTRINRWINMLQEALEP